MESCKIIGRAVAQKKSRSVSERKEHELFMRRKRYAENRDSLNQHRRERYAEDPEYRERERKRKRESNAKYCDARRSYAKEYRRLHPEKERARSMRRRLELREYEIRRSKRRSADAEFLKKESMRKREDMRRYRIKVSIAKADPKTPADFIRLWEAVAKGGPKKVAAYMKVVQEPVKSRFLHWYGKKMNWIDATGQRRFQPPPGADIAVESDDFFFS